MNPILAGLEGSSLAGFVRSSLWVYPAIEIVHIVGFVVLVGAAFIFDLRLLGKLGALPISEGVRHLTRWARWSLVLVVPSGLLLFMVDASTLASNPSFQLKLALMAAAGVNAGVFHFVVYRGVDPAADPAWNGAGPAPVAARVIAVLSILLWCSVIATGRLIAYV